MEPRLKVSINAFIQHPTRIAPDAVGQCGVKGVWHIRRAGASLRLYFTGAGCNTIMWKKSIATGRVAGINFMQLLRCASHSH